MQGDSTAVENIGHKTYMEVITVKIGDPIRTRRERNCPSSSTPTGIVAWAGDGEVVIVLRDDTVDSVVTMYRVANEERERRQRQRVLDARLSRRAKKGQRQLEKREAS